MGPSVMAFVARSLSHAEVAGKRVLEIGAYDVNGSVRPYLESLSPRSYLGVDIVPGPRVDLICDINDLVDRFGEDSFDVVICTESVEHMQDWQRAISNMKRTAVPGGKVLVTTVGPGFPYHAHPHDYWRFTPEDMQVIFADCQIDRLETAPAGNNSLSIFVAVTKPENFQETLLDGYQLYAVTPTAL